MLTEQEIQVLAAVRAKIRALPGMTDYHAFELETSLDLVTSAFENTPEQFAEWSHITLVVDAEMFENAGFDVSGVTKDDLDTLADALKDYWMIGKEWDRALEYAAEGVLERAADDDESEEDANDEADAEGAPYDPACDANAES